MIKYIAPKHASALLKVDITNGEAEAVDRTSDNIDTLYIVPENGEFEGKPVIKGDIIILMYGYKEDNKRATFILHNEELYDYYKSLEEKRKQREANMNLCCECDCISRRA